MRLRWRSKEAPSRETDDEYKAEEAESALREARSALQEVRQRNREGSFIARTLHEIRKNNHFQEIWNEGLEGR